MPAHWDATSEELFKSARREAEALQHNWIGTEHLGLAMLMEPGSMLCRKLDIVGGVPDLAKRIRQALEGQAPAPDVTGLHLTPRLRQIVSVADHVAADEGSDTIAERHLLQALIEGGPGVFIRAVLAAGIEPGALWRASRRAAVLEATVVSEGTAAPPRPPPVLRRGPLPISLGHNPALVDFGVVTLPQASSRTPLLDRLATPILPPRPAVPRPALLQELSVALCRGGPGATILVGAGGCGKTALLGLLVDSIQRGDVASELQGLRLLQMPALDILTPRFEEVVAEVRGQLVALVLDEIHLPLLQDGYSALKRLLDAPPIVLLGTTTPEGLHERLATQDGLRRRLRVVEVPPTAASETLAILTGRVPALQQRHGVKIDAAALEAVVRTPGPMPATALDVLDEACIRARSAGGNVTVTLVDSLRGRR